MQKTILAIVCVFFLTSTLSGCGLFIAIPSECTNEFPTTSARNVFLWDKYPSKRSTKEEFIKEWGTPTKILSTSENKETGYYETRLSPSENRETWVYERSLWCGFGPIIFFVPIPLLLPVCDGFDRIEFQGNEAKNLYIRRIRSVGGVIFPPIAGGADPVCRYNIPIDIGMDRAEVIKIMGDPLKIAVYALEGKQLDVLFYSKSWPKKALLRISFEKGLIPVFRIPVETDLIPVVFENNRVTGWDQFHFEQMTKKSISKE